MHLSLLAIAPYLNDFINLVFAILLGGLIGFEREYHEKKAGIRTHAVVSLGACLFTIVSFHTGEKYGGDYGRIAAQIVSGIGFLGAGTILQERDKIKGLTTAATIWISAAIGMACGAKLIIQAGSAVVLTIIALVLFRQVTRYFHQVRCLWILNITFASDISEARLKDIENQLAKILTRRGLVILELNRLTESTYELIFRGNARVEYLHTRLRNILPSSAQIEIKQIEH
ncbi:MAG: MgtC/SapB family protein [Candidatus Caenarcaniphilales bacterium]|nr:MgtC/SapB family protein [Candidatus Caenarcaniphilales bacterium]